jgi:hypothetical protein
MRYYLHIGHDSLLLSPYLLTIHDHLPITFDVTESLRNLGFNQSTSLEVGGYKSYVDDVVLGCDACGLAGRYQRFGGTYFSPKLWYLPTSLHGVTTQNNIDLLPLTLVRKVCIYLHGVTTQNIEIFTREPQIS